MLPGVRSIVLQNMSFSDITVFESMKELEKLVVVCPDMASFMDDTLISIWYFLLLFFLFLSSSSSFSELFF